MSSYLYGTVNSQIAIDLGCQLKAARMAKGLSVAMISEVLVLPEKQINGMEMAEFSSFYGPYFYIGALKKYAAFLGVAFEASLLLDSNSSALTLSDQLREERASRFFPAYQYKPRDNLVYQIIFFIISKRLFIRIVLTIIAFFVIWGFIQSERKASEGRPIGKQQDIVENLEASEIKPLS